MRLIRVTLRDFRGVMDTTVRFSDGITVVEGPNEVGKSSIAEAIRHIRDMKSSSKHRDIISLKPVDRDVGPEAEMELRTGPYELTYRKRWRKGPLAELTVSAPAPEHLSGDQAHERFLEILAETVDVDLLVAMDIVQGESLDQPDLAKISSLQRALDDSSDDPVGHDALMERIKKEYEQHFTSTGKTTGEYKKASELLALLEGELDALQTRSTEMDRFGEEHTRHTKLLTDLAEKLEAAREELTKRESETKGLEELQRAVEKSTRERDEARRHLEEQLVAKEARLVQVKDLGVRAQNVAGQTSALETLSDNHGVAKRRFEAAREAEADGDERRATAREAAKAARATLELYRDRAECNELTDGLKRAREAERLRVEAAAVLKDSLVDNDTIAKLTDLNTEVQVAESARTAAAATVVVRAIGAQSVTVDGRAVPGGNEHDAVALDTVHVEVDGIVSIEVRPGTPPADLDHRADQAQEALRMALRDAGVESIEEARQVSERGNVAQTELEKAESTLQHVLGSSTIKAIEERVAGVSARIARQPQNDSHPHDLNMIENAAESAGVAEKEAEEELEKARTMLEGARNKAETAREAWVRATETLKVAREEHDKLAERIDQARHEHDDASLEAAAVEAEASVAERQTHTESDQAALDAADPETLEMLLRNAQELVDSTREERDRIRKRVDELGALLDDRASQGIYELLTNAKAACDATRSSLQRLDRAAKSVQLLREILFRKRDEAQQKYVAPFKERIERLGRVIFGRDFTVQVSKDLAIDSRTLDGRTVPFASLSAGAREQLSLLGRLACAQLVDESEGAPVILDDTLGFADPQRLAALNVVLNDVGQTAQVVLLTCQPQRFSALGGAQVVRLPA